MVPKIFRDLSALVQQEPYSEVLIINSKHTLKSRDCSVALSGEFIRIEIFVCMKKATCLKSVKRRPQTADTHTPKDRNIDRKIARVVML